MVKFYSKLIIASIFIGAALPVHASWRSEENAEDVAIDLDKTWRPYSGILAFETDDSTEVLLRDRTLHSRLSDWFIWHRTLPNYVGYTDLHRASNLGSVKDVEEALRRGNDVNGRTCDGYTPLHFASKRGCVGVVRKLLDSGATVEAATGHNIRPLHEAAIGGHPEVIKLLLDRGADPTAVVTSFAVKGIASNMVCCLDSNSSDSDCKKAYELLLKAEKKWSNKE